MCQIDVCRISAGTQWVLPRLNPSMVTNMPLFSWINTGCTIGCMGIILLHRFLHCLISSILVLPHCKTNMDLFSVCAAIGLRSIDAPEGGSDHPEIRVQRSQPLRHGWYLTLRRDRAVRLEINCGWNRSERDGHSGGVIDDCRLSVPKVASNDLSRFADDPEHS
jgi:hypothetical protein